MPRVRCVGMLNASGAAPVSFFVGQDRMMAMNKALIYALASFALAGCEAHREAGVAAVSPPVLVEPAAAPEAVRVPDTSARVTFIWDELFNIEFGSIEVGAVEEALHALPPFEVRAPGIIFSGSDSFGTPLSYDLIDTRYHLPRLDLDK
jgi:hypothetical protein